MSKSKSSKSTDIIDIYAKPDIKLKVLEPRQDRELRVELEGQSINHAIVNAVRRSVMLYIPIYGFHRSNIHIELNKFKNMYNFDLMYNIFETLPIFDVPNFMDLIDPDVFLPVELSKNLFGRFVQEQYTEQSDQEDKLVDATKKLFKIELTLNYKNNTADDKYISSHDCVIKIDGKTSDGYLKRRPICLFVLKPSEEISLRAEANLGIAKNFAAYEATTNAIHEEKNPNKYVITYKTLEQLNKYVILNKACTIIYKKLENLQDYLLRTYTEDRDPTEQIDIELYGEDHTLGTILENVLQQCEYVEKAGYCMPHLLIDKILVSYKLYDDSEIGPIKVLNDCITYLIKLYKQLADLVPRK
ncbi:putative DNA directed RNA polymerase subunit [Acanthamoeba polyphaga mimivirus]|uniref:DNA directed RNA polymerase subunit n=1 Tax=Acanthamoeba polyphaga mimivirus Kroon TaxID=3069720 RepID=A0A0G2Y366_9VIRU|nr:putative DNA directed RNA polymerase subunit [Acanthamoeba polyphaga mimivirus]AKI80203.1 putative DNA directed RNA polymerase subunit [Acanthamoeba polyphaga mimivirus Kroon]